MFNKIHTHNTINIIPNDPGIAEDQIATGDQYQIPPDGDPCYPSEPPKAFDLEGEAINKVWAEGFAYFLRDMGSR